jgi:alkanesulfonate monooxygenase SsuD/methylene tetrahydromethanopterin reductase-like flavin-dependent oxidoreductase (luciferase family)
MAKIGDGWFPQQRAGDRGREAIERIRTYVEDAGREAASFGIEGRINLLTVTPENEWGDTLQWWRDIGATHVSLNTMGAGLASPQAHVETLRRFVSVMR